tara:strand:- start:2747 stop:3685 length:939 start_codon:yes stop_codon:yes gene_type:complete
VSEIDPKKALSAIWLNEYSVKVIVPKNLVFKVRLLKKMWESLNNIDSKTERDKLLGSVCQGSSTRAIQGYRKTNWKVEENSRVKINHEDWNQSFDVYLTSVDRKKRYSFTFNDQVESLKISDTVEEKVNAITIQKVAERKRQIEESYQEIEINSEEEREEIARNILLDYSTGMMDITEACMRNNLRYSVFTQWIFTSPVIREMFNEARNILSAVFTVRMERNIDRLILEKLETGFTKVERIKYDYVTDTESLETIPVEESKIEEHKEITITELTNLRKLLGDYDPLKSKLPNEFKDWSEEKLKKFIGESSNK